MDIGDAGSVSSSAGAVPATTPLVPGPAVGDRDQEQRALVEVQQRLRDRFPELDPPVVEAAVRVAHTELTGPIRDFAPLLVEKAARDRLASAIREAPEEARRALED
jgi:hypothetical protein